MTIFNLSALLYNLHNNQLRSFDVSNFKKLAEITLGQDLQFASSLIAATILPNGHLACLTENFFQIFDVNTHQCIKEFSVPFDKSKHSQGAVTGLHVLPDGNKILISRAPRYATHSWGPHSTGECEIWDLTTGQCLLRPVGSPQILIDNQSALELYMNTGVWSYGGDRSTASFNPIEANLSSNMLASLPTSLKTISLKLGALTQQDILPLLEAMCNFPDTLRLVSLKGITLDERGFQQILALIQTNTRLKSLNLKDTGLKNEQQITIKQTWIEKRFKLEGLVFTSVVCSASDLTPPLLFSDFFVPDENIILAEPPVRYLCPITQEIMFNPVVAFDGHTYEEEAIQQHLSKKNTSPMTNAVLPDTRLIPNFNLRSEIREFLDKNSIYWQQVYLSEALCQQTETACRENNPELLQQLLQQDRRLLTNKIIENKTKFIFEKLCEQGGLVWSTLFPLVANSLTPTEWKTLLKNKPIKVWWNCIAKAPVSQQEMRFAASFFITILQSTFNKIIHPFELALYALEQNELDLFRLSLTLLENVNQQDGHGNTLLHRIMMQPDTPHTRAIIKQLLTLGADHLVKNQLGQTVEVLCEQQNLASLATFIRAESQKQLIRMCMQEQGETQTTLAFLLNKVSALEAELVYHRTVIANQQAALNNFELGANKCSNSADENTQGTNKCETIWEKISALSEEVVTLKSENSRIEQETETRLTDALNDQHIREKLYSPNKNYLKCLFSAITPAFTRVDKTIKKEMAREKETKAREAFLRQQDALIAACSRGDIHQVKQLHQNGASLEEPNSQGEYSLSAACFTLAISVIDYINTASKTPEQLWMQVGDDERIMQVWDKKITDKKIARISEQTTYVALDEVLTHHVATRCDIMPAINDLIAAWDKCWQQGHGCEGMNTYMQQTNSQEGGVKALSQRHNGQRLWTDSDFCGSSTQRYYGSQVREKRNELVNYINTCLNQIDYISEKISSYQRRIQEIQRIVHYSRVFNS